MSANITKSSVIDLADVHAPIRVTVEAGETIADGSPVFIHTDGKAYKAVSTECTISNVTKYDGMVIRGNSIGNPVTLFGVGTKIKIADATLTIGAFYFVSATAGALYDAKVASADTYFPVCKAITSSVVEVVRTGI
jgi:hypothetical protein